MLINDAQAKDRQKVKKKVDEIGQWVGQFFGLWSGRQKCKNKNEKSLSLPLFDII